MLETEDAKRKLLKELIHAAEGGDLSRVQELVAKGAPPGEFRFRANPLIAAVAAAHPEVVRWLLDHGVSVNLRPATPLYWTPLICAADRGHTEIVKLLLERGADVFAYADPANRSTTAKWYALHGRHVEVLAVLDEAERLRRPAGKVRPKAGIQGIPIPSVLLLLLAPFTDSTAAFAKSAGAVRVNRQVLSREVRLGGRDYFALSMLGARWTVIGGLTEATTQDALPRWAQNCSEVLGCEAIVCAFSDDPQVLKYDYWSRGLLEESYEFSADAVMKELEREKGQGNVQARFRRLVNMGRGSVFRSSLREVEDTGKPKAFIDSFLKKHKAYVPSIETGRASPGSRILLTSMFARDVDELAIVSLE